MRRPGDIVVGGVTQQESKALLDQQTQELLCNPMQHDMFNGVDRLFIKQERTAVEFLGIEAKNKYRISQATDDNKEGPVFLYITEESQGCERVYCNANRSLKLLVHRGATKFDPVIQTMEKPFSCDCPCCSCCCRPSFDVKAGSVQVGYVKDPCRCCHMDQQVFSANQNLIFTTTGSQCQKGMWWPCCFGIDFEVEKDGEEIGNVEKLPLNFEEMLLGNQNRFIIDMTDVKDPMERRMMLASAMLLDLADSGGWLCSKMQ